MCDWHLFSLNEIWLSVWRQEVIHTFICFINISPAHSCSVIHPLYHLDRLVMNFFIFYVFSFSCIYLFYYYFLNIIYSCMHFNCTLPFLVITAYVCLKDKCVIILQPTICWSVRWRTFLEQVVSQKFTLQIHILFASIPLYTVLWIDLICPHLKKTSCAALRMTMHSYLHAKNPK